MTAESKDISVLAIFLEEQQMLLITHLFKTYHLDWVCLHSLHAPSLSYWILFQWINQQSVSKDGPAVFSHFGLLLGPDRTGGTH